MCKPTLLAMDGQGLAMVQPELFDVVAFNQAGERCQVISAGVLLSGAIACARGFNGGRRADLVAVVLPASSNESSKPSSHEASPAAVLCDRNAQ